MSTSSRTNFTFRDTLRSGRESASDCASSTGILLAFEKGHKIAALPLASSQLRLTSVSLRCHESTYEDQGGGVHGPPPKSAPGLVNYTMPFIISDSSL